MDASGQEVTASVGPDQTVSECVISATAAVTDTEPTALPPLYRSVDGDALDRLCASADRSPLRVSFRFGRCTVTVEDDRVTVVDDDD